MNEGQEVARPRGILMTAVALAVACSWMAYRFPSALDGYRELFTRSGAELPLTTKFVLGAPYLWWLFALLSVAFAVWVGYRDRLPVPELRRMKRSLRLLLVVTLVAYAGAVFSLFLPTFNPGSGI